MNNNILFDNATKKALCVIDLDTIMPGFAAFDFGDAIRFGANKGLEDEVDLSKVGLDIELFEAFTKGFLKACGNSLNKKEIELYRSISFLLFIVKSINLDSQSLQNFIHLLLCLYARWNQRKTEHILYHSHIIQQSLTTSRITIYKEKFI